MPMPTMKKDNRTFQSSPSPLTIVRAQIAQSSPAFLFLILLIFLLILYIIYCLVKSLIECIYTRDLAGRHVLIVGCDSGFGEAMAMRCVRDGAHVYASVVNEASIEALHRKCAHPKGKVHPFLMDISKDESVAAGHQFVSRALPPGEGLYAIIANAGIGRLGQDHWLTSADYEQVWQVNTLGHIRVTHKFRPLMVAAGGRLVYTTSICGRVALPGYGPYCVSKFALEAYADTLRREAAPFGLRVIIVTPGFHRTLLTTPENIVSAFTHSWTKAPEEVKAIYGEEFFNRQNAMFTKLLSSPLFNSPKSQNVVNAYYHALTSPFPKNRYPVGVDAHLTYVPLSLMPAGFQDAYLRSFNRIMGAPTPAALEPKKVEKNDHDPTRNVRRVKT